MTESYTPVQGDLVTVAVPSWLSAEKHLDSTTVTGKIRMVTAKALLLIPDGKQETEGVWMPLGQIQCTKHIYTPAGLVAKASNTQEYPPSNTTPWQHQRQAMLFMEGREWGGIFMEMGCGKTKVAVDLLLSRNCKKILIVCPKSVVNVWPSQFMQHGIKPALVYAANSDQGSVAERTARCQQSLAWAEEHNIPCAIVINYEASIHEPFFNWAREYHWDAVVADEIHRAKSYNGVISKSVWAFARYRKRYKVTENGRSFYQYRMIREAKLRLGLTGTPIPHSPLDIFAQWRILDDNVFGLSYTRFLDRYAIAGSEMREIRSVEAFHARFGQDAILAIPLNELCGAQRSKVYGRMANKIIVGYRNQDEFYHRIHDGSFRVLASDVLDLPSVMDEYRTYKLTGEARRIYNDLEQEMFAEIDGGKCTPSNILVKLLRLSQVANGNIKDDNSVDHRINEDKGNLLSDILEDISNDEKVVVFYRFTQDLVIIRKVGEKFNRHIGEVSGRVHDLTDEAKYPPELNLLCVQLAAGSVGVDLSAARYGIWYSNSYDRGNYMQARARIHRPGATRPIEFFHLIADGTVDETIEKALRDGEDLVRAVMTRDRKGNSNANNDG